MNPRLAHEPFESEFTLSLFTTANAVFTITNFSHNFHSRHFAPPLPYLFELVYQYVVHCHISHEVLRFELHFNNILVRNSSNSIQISNSFHCEIRKNYNNATESRTSAQNYSHVALNLLLHMLLCLLIVNYMKFLVQDSFVHQARDAATRH